MPDKRISDLDQGNALQGGELIPMDQNSSTRITSPLAILTYILANINTGQIAESLNLFFTNARADARVALHANRIDNPHSVTAAQLGLDNVQNLKNNFGATTNPDSSNDSSSGYSIGSIWINVTADKIFICTDNSLAAALWRDITNVSVDKAFVGLGNVENTALSTWAGSSNITTIALAAITAWVGSINHDALLNYSSNKHVDHSSLNINSGEGLTGGGSLLTSRTLAMNVPGLSALTDPIDSINDKLLIYDNSATAHKYCTLNDLSGIGRIKVLAVSANYLAGISDSQTLFSCSNTMTLSFVPAATLGSGWSCYVRNDGVTSIIIDPDSSETIDTLTSLKVYPGESFEIVCDGTGFKTIGRRRGEILLETFKITSAVSAVDFTKFLGDFNEIIFKFKSVMPVTDGVDAYLKFSLNSGSTFPANHNYVYADTVGSSTSGANTSLIKMNRTTIGNAGGEGWKGTINLIDAGGSQAIKSGDFRSVWRNTSGGLEDGGGSFDFVDSLAISLVRFMFSSGNIASGILTSWGVREAS